MIGALLLSCSVFTAGKFALQALVGGSLDLVTVADLPVVLAVLNGEQLSIVSVINGTVGGIPMVLRKGSNDTFNPQGYFSRKRKIGTLVGAGVEFFAAEFFKKHNIQSSQYEIVSMRPEDMPIALARGDLDGIAIFDPYAHFAIEKTGEDEVFVIKDGDLYSEIIVLAGKKDWVSQNESVVVKVLRALKKSEAFVKSNQEEAIDIVSSFTKLDQETLRVMWPFLKPQLGLGSKLVLTMEQEAQWAKDTGKVKKETIIPDFRNHIFAIPLKVVSPDVVEL